MKNYLLFCGFVLVLLVRNVSLFVTSSSLNGSYKEIMDILEESITVEDLNTIPTTDDGFKTETLNNINSTLWLSMSLNEDNNKVDPYRINIGQLSPEVQHFKAKFSLSLSFSCPDDGDSNANITILNTSSPGVKEEIGSWSCNESYRPTTQKALKDLESIEVIPSGLWTNETKVRMIAQIYFDAGEGNCPKKYFNCNNEGQSTHCGDMSSTSQVWNRMLALPTKKSFPDEHLNNNVQEDSWKNPNHRYYSKKVPNSRSICIPNSQLCDGIESCKIISGSSLRVSLDESDVVCNRCVDFIDWGFIITRSIAAIVFVMIPTLVIFVLFYRRQMILHRTRLAREVEMARRQRAFSFDTVGSSDARFANDLPPTYDDVYDTKEPPPCFCKAVYEDSIKTNNLHRESMGLNDHTDARSRIPSISIIDSSGINNPGFECVCKSPLKS